MDFACHIIYSLLVALKVGPSLTYAFCTPIIPYDRSFTSGFSRHLLIVNREVKMFFSKRITWELPEPLIIWAAEMCTVLFDLRLKGLLALTMYFTSEQLCRWPFEV